MLNYLWGFMILTGIIYAALSGTLPVRHRCGVKLGKRGGRARDHDGWSHVFLGGPHADRGGGGHH